MCLAVPAEIIELLDDEMAIANLGGISKTISISLLDELNIGDYVLIHTGYALNKIDTEEAKKTLELFEEIGYDLSNKED
ncbi:HypC/HybG/HupF family hydrogenase formation chaperone [Pseudomonadota bacterium]